METAPNTVTKPELLVAESDRTFRHFIHNMLAFSSRIEAVRSGFGNAIGLSGIQYTILISIRHLQAEKWVGINQIAEHLHLSGAFVTIETGKLVKLGLVEKAPHPTDGRRVCLTVTDGGADLLRQLATTQCQVNDVLFEALTAREFRALAGIVEKLIPCGDRAVGLVTYLQDAVRGANMGKRGQEAGSD